MAQDITVPDLGDFKDVEVIDVLVKPGDKIEVDTPLITLETEKATMDVPATAAGVVKAVAVKKGDRVSKGSVIAQVEAGAAAPRSSQQGCCTPGAASRAAPPAPPAPEPAKPAAEASRSRPLRSGTDARSAHAAASHRRQLPLIDEAGFARAHASPSVRKFARELGVDLGRGQRHGPQGAHHAPTTSRRGSSRR